MIVNYFTIISLRPLNGVPGGIRTPDLLIRSQTLYPTELQVPIGHHIIIMYLGTYVNTKRKNNWAGFKTSPI